MPKQETEVQRAARLAMAKRKRDEKRAELEAKQPPPRDRSAHFELHRWTCTCPHFEHRASKIELVSPRETREARVCKHIHGVQDNLDKIPKERRRNEYVPLYQCEVIKRQTDVTWEIAPADGEKRKLPGHDYVIKRINLKPLDGQLVDATDYYTAKGYFNFEGTWMTPAAFEMMMGPP